MENKITTVEMEISLAKHFNYRQNLIVPNISWGLFLHECDLLVLSKSGYAKEIEIKIDKYDLIKDKEKRHGHHDPRIKYLYFAIPNYLQEYTNHIPDRAGIIIVKRLCKHLSCKTIRKPEKNGNYKFSEKEKYKLACLGSMRIFPLKQKLLNLNNGE